ncbi:hypothetical protein OG331_25155 [Streptomyces sp. NBC_01017]|uniref:hypothetical protein n=1 Tax=Streptomyces sp. NBC_01017 TaxID=2903721 RepID=UPI00386FE684|nr:hypothetical protein OG331_25155 [Streptomyces sp. NBC_01017]
MHIRHTIVAVAALAFALNGCSSPTESSDKAARKPEASPSPATSSAFLRPTSAQEKVLIRGLTAIDPGLTVKESRAISRSVGVCDDIRTGKDHATVVHNAAFRYDGGNASVDDTKAAKIVEVIKTSFCKA